jgi:hypothetical protein
LADPLCRPRALVRPRGAACGHLRLARGPGACR